VCAAAINVPVCQDTRGGYAAVASTHQHVTADEEEVGEGVEDLKLKEEAVNEV
jgi:tartrate dehydratase alpha subunit/fumarate hydratase class I-like protein